MTAQTRQHCRIAIRLGIMLGLFMALIAVVWLMTLPTPKDRTFAWISIHVLDRDKTREEVDRDYQRIYDGLYKENYANGPFRFWREGMNLILGYDPKLVTESDFRIPYAVYVVPVSMVLIMVLLSLLMVPVNALM